MSCMSAPTTAFVNQDSSATQNAFVLTGEQRWAILLAVRGRVNLSFPKSLANRPFM